MRGHGAKLRVGGSEEQGPIAGQASGDRGPKQGKVAMPMLVTTAMSPEAHGVLTIHKDYAGHRSG